MRTDNIIKREGFKALFEKPGLVEAERFIALIKRNSQFLLSSPARKSHLL